MSGRIAAINDVVRVLNELAVALACLSDFFQIALSFRDVFDDAFVRDDVPQLIPGDGGVLTDMNQVAVAAPPCALERANLAALVEDAFEHDALLPIGVISIQIPVCELVLGRVAEHRPQRRIRDQKIAIRRDAVDTDRDPLDERAIGALCPSGCRDIVERGHGAGDPSLCIHDGRRSHINDYRSLRSADLHVHHVDALAAKRAHRRQLIGRIGLVCPADVGAVAGSALLRSDPGLGFAAQDLFCSSVGV